MSLVRLPGNKHSRISRTVWTCCVNAVFSLTADLLYFCFKLFCSVCCHLPSCDSSLPAKTRKAVSLGENRQRYKKSEWFVELKLKNLREISHGRDCPHRGRHIQSRPALETCMVSLYSCYPYTGNKDFKTFIITDVALGLDSDTLDL